MPARRSPTGRQYYTHDQYLEYCGWKAKGAGTTIAYAQVPGQSQKPALQNQQAVLRACCQRQNFRAAEWIGEAGSSLNYQCKQFNRLREEIECGVLPAIAWS